MPFLFIYTFSLKYWQCCTLYCLEKCNGSAWAISADSDVCIFSALPKILKRFNTRSSNSFNNILKINININIYLNLTFIFIFNCNRLRAFCRVERVFVLVHSLEPYAVVDGLMTGTNQKCRD